MIPEKVEKLKMEIWLRRNEDMSTIRMFIKALLTIMVASNFSGSDTSVRTF